MSGRPVPRASPAAGVPVALPLALVFALLLPAAATPASAREGAELAPYRALVLRRPAADSLLAAARAGLAAAFEEVAPDAPAAPAWPGSVRPLYVTLVHGRATRACVGADVPPGGSLGDALFALGRQLADADLRHPPLRAGETDTLRLVVAFAGDAEPVGDPMLVDPVREGLRIETERGTVAFLPGEARTVAWALSEARRIGVLAGRTADARFSRFLVVAVQGPASAPARHP